VQDVADDEADDQRHRRHREEVADGERADLADLRGLGHRADAEHDRAEDDRADHHLDQVDEPGAERLQFLPDLRPHQTDQDAGRDRDDHGDVEEMGPVTTTWTGRLFNAGHETSWQGWLRVIVRTAMSWVTFVFIK
jgi:hypothetical protein